MIARIAGRGNSFKGAGLYYLHDKESETSDRVAWTETRNIPVNDPEAATKWMAYTAINANELKQNAGVPLSGRKREKGVVYTFSLSWSPDESPDRQQMKKAADETLDILGLKDHESLLVAHQDTKHPHIHIICNLVNPENGRMHDPDWGAKLKLSDWSLKHENDNGKIYCKQRVKNSQDRKKGSQVRYSEPVHNRKEQIQNLYRQSDNGAAFSNALNQNGYILAKGNRRRFVLVDDYGNIHSLSRQLDKEQRKSHLQKLSDLNHSNLPLAQSVAEKRKYFDRDKQASEQEQKIIDAAISQEKVKAENQKQQMAKRKEWQKIADKKRADLEDVLKTQYDRAAHVQLIKAYQRELKANDNKWGRLTGYFNTLSEGLQKEKLTLSNVDMRIAEAREALESELSKTRPQQSKGGQSKNLSNQFEAERHKKAKTEREDKTKDYMNRLEQYRKHRGYDLDR